MKRDIRFDASRSNNIYGASTTVQPESHDWIACVVAFGKATNVGSVDVANVMSAVSQVQSKIEMILPIGSVIASATNTTPDGYLICNGAAISRTTYAALFNAIGTIFGNGDGSTTFNLPNLIDRFIQGSETVGTVLDAGLPNITGMATFVNSDGVDQVYNPDTGCFYWGQYAYGNKAVNTAGTGKRDLKFNASRSNGIYGKSSTVQPPALCLLPCIRYE